MLFPSLISQKPGEIPIFRTFLAKFSISAYSLKIGYFGFGHDYDVTVTSYLGCWYYFDRPPAILCYQLDFYFQVHGGGNSPLGRRVTNMVWYSYHAYTLQTIIGA